MKVIEDKLNNRKAALQMRNSFAECGLNRNKSSIITQEILNSNEFKVSKNIALYYPIKNEIDITGILNVKYKNFYLPRCNNGSLEFVLYKGKDYLKVGLYGIFEPIGEAIKPEILDIIYVPALMANSNNYRLGYGKGYYDRFFETNIINALTLIIVAREFISDDFVQDNHDYKCHGIISA